LGGFEVNFLPEYKALHDAGYNILCYDIRNHGLRHHVIDSPRLRCPTCTPSHEGACIGPSESRQTVP
jgi:hypothetical protein